MMENFSRQCELMVKDTFIEYEIVFIRAGGSEGFERRLSAYAKKMGIIE